MKNIWKNIQKDLSKIVSTSAYNLWLSQLEGYVEDTTLVVISPTKYVATRINNKYKCTIAQIASALASTTLNVRVEIASAPTTKMSFSNEKSFLKVQSDMPFEFSKKSILSISENDNASSNSFPHNTEEINTKKMRENTDESTVIPSTIFDNKELSSSIGKRLPRYTSRPSRTSVSHTTKNEHSNLVENTIQELQNLHEVSNKQVEKHSGESPFIPSSCGMNIPIEPSSSGKKQTQLTLDLHIKRSPKSFQYSFNNFIVGECNSLAFASSQSLCDINSSLASTLYLSSPPGLGKTHLLQSLGKELIQVSNVKNLQIEYLSAEDFTSQFTLAMQRKELGEFLGNLKNADVFLLEDVHFLQGKEKIQSQLLSIIKSLQAQGSRIAVSSSFSLKEVKQMDEQLSSCFQEGYVANIAVPNFSVRKQIVESKAKSYNVFLPDTVADILAENICSDIRQIEGCLKTIILKARSMKQEINPSIAMEILSAYDVSEKKITFDDIIATVCKYFGLPLDRLTSKTRQKECVIARNLIFYLTRSNTDMTLKEIAQFFNRQHSTVIKGITNVELEIVRSTPKAQQMLSVVTLLDPYKVIHA
ncbi:MAG: DnaA ATPase domain-containing protein [Desulfovibrionaceae bacterium]